MKLLRPVAALGCAILVCGATDQVRAQEAARLRSLLIVPSGSPVGLRTINEQDGLAEFAGRFVLSGRFRYGCTDECLKPFPRQEMRLYFFPDADLTARLPHWCGYTATRVIEIENPSAFAAKVVPRVTMRRLEFGRQNWAEGHMSIVVDHFRTGLECDSAWYSARFIGVAQHASFKAVHDKAAGCD